MDYSQSISPNSNTNRKSLPAGSSRPVSAFSDIYNHDLWHSESVIQEPFFEYDIGTPETTRTHVAQVESDRESWNEDGEIRRPHSPTENRTADSTLKSGFGNSIREDPLDVYPFARNKLHLVDANSARIQDLNSFPSRHRYQVFRSWKAQIIQLSVAAGLLVAIFALLAKFNGQNVPDWGYAINLSTLLALVATIFRALVMAVLAVIISQAKWSWFSGRQARPFQQFQDFDQGSRGSWGAALLIPKVLGHDFVPTIAALMMIISLAVGSFVQQAIKTKNCQHPVIGEVASIPYAHYVPRQTITYQEGEVALFGSPNQELQLAIYTSLASPDGAVNQISPVCPTGNCTFPGGDPLNRSVLSNSEGNSSIWSTAGLCSSCADVSALVTNKSLETISGPYNSINLPNGLSISYQAYGTYLNASTDSDFAWAEDILDPDFTKVTRWALANFTTLTFTADGCVSPPISSECSTFGEQSIRSIAMSCTLYPCVRSYNPLITNGNFSEPQVDTAMMWPLASVDLCTGDITGPINGANNRYCHYAGVHLPCLVDGTVYTAQNMSSSPNLTKLQFLNDTQVEDSYFRNISAPEQCIYRHNAGFGNVMADFFKSTIFTGECSSDPRLADGVSCDQTSEDGEQPNAIASMWMTTVYNSGNATPQAIESYFESFSTAMTNNYRTTFGSSVFNDSLLLDINNLLPQGEVQGLVWKSSVCTSMQWEWLLLPAILWLISSFLLFWTIVKSWRLRHVKPVWKDNVFPAMLYRERFTGDNGSALSQIGADSLFPQAVLSKDEQSGKLMELEEVKEIASKTVVKFKWADDMGEEFLDITTPENKKGFELKGLIKRQGWPLNKLDTSRETLLAES